ASMNPRPTRALAGPARQPACHSRADSAVSSSRLKAARHLQLHVGAGAVPGPGDGDPEPPVEIQAGRHVPDDHVEHVQVRRVIAAHLGSLPDKAGAGTVPAGPAGYLLAPERGSAA